MEPIATSEHVNEFEGDTISKIEVRIPATVVVVDESHLRGTHLRANVELRVKNVYYVEGGKGDLVRAEVVAVEWVQFQSSFAADQIQDDIGGSATAYAEQDAEGAAELGLTIGRSSDHWGPDSAVGF